MDSSANFNDQERKEIIFLLRVECGFPKRDVIQIVANRKMELREYLNSNKIDRENDVRILLATF